MTGVCLQRSPRGRATWWGLIAIALLCLPSTTFAQTTPTPTDGIVLPDASITTRADATSVELNPAGLGFMRYGQLALGVQHADADVEGIDSEGVAAFLAGGTGRIGGGLGVQWLDRPVLGVNNKDYRKYTLGAGVSTASNVSLGAAFNFFGSSDNKQLDDLTSWDVGLMWRPSDNVGFGLRVRDLNQPFLNDTHAIPIRTAIGAALRFFDGRAILDPMVEFISDADAVLLRPRVLLEPIYGLRLFARTDFNFQFQNDQTTTSWDQTIFGLALNTSNLGIESAAITKLGDDSGYRGQTYLGWVGRRVRRGLGGSTHRWILVDLNGGIDEQPSSSFFAPSKRSFLSLVNELEKLSNDDSVEGVVFNVGSSGLGYAQIWEVRQQIAALRKAGKKTVSVLTNPTYRETYLASAAEKLWLIPPEPYSPDGLSLTMTSYAETLAKAGIQAEFLRISHYKSAPESYTYRQPSKEALQETNAYLDGIYSRTVQALANDRGKSPAAIKKMVDSVPIYPADAVKQGFADKVVYLDYIRKRLKDAYGYHVELDRQYPKPKTPDTRWGERPQIAVVVLEGAIVRGQSGRTPLIDETIAGSDTLTAIFDRLRRDSSVRAVVVRIDSPGGSAVASDLIYREMRRLAQKKPVITSMGNVAASGGYYAAAGADEIFATPNTLTGSVGIFAGKFSVSKLADLIGVNTTRLQRGSRSGSFNIFRPWTAAQRDSVARSITYLYRMFTQQVARTRPLSAEQVDAVGRGHIWDGVAAKKNKLVDHLGGLMDAIHRAEKLAGVRPQDVDYKLYPKSLGLFNLSSASVHARSSLFAKVFGADQDSAVLDATSALGALVRSIGKGILMPALYQDGEPLMLLPFVVDMK